MRVESGDQPRCYRLVGTAEAIENNLVDAEQVKLPRNVEASQAIRSSAARMRSRRAGSGAGAPAARCAGSADSPA